MNEGHMDTPGAARALLLDIEHRLLTMEMDAHDRFNAAMAALGNAALQPVASQHCEAHRIEAHAYRRARVALMDAFRGEAT